MHILKQQLNRHRKKVKNIFLVKLSLLSLSLPLVSKGASFKDAVLGGVHDAGTAIMGTEQRLSGPEHGLEIFLINIVNILLTFVGVVFLVLLVYGGYLWLNARGKEETITKAKRLMFDAVIGLIVIVSARIITLLILFALQRSNVPL